MKTILFIGAGFEQYELLKKAKEMGYYVIATNPTYYDLTYSISDRFFIHDPIDTEFYYKIAKNYKIDGIVTDNCDYSLYTASLISNKLKLASIDLESAYCSINKIRQREKCSKSKILNQPRWGKFNTYDEYILLCNKIGLPRIVKPIDSRGTFGVTVDHSGEYITEAFYHAISNSPSRTGIIETFISGTLFTVDGFCFNNGHFSLAVASRKYESGIKPVTKEIIYPAKVKPIIIQNLKNFHQEVVKKLGYNRGHTHGEYIIDKENKIYLVECTNRGGGVFTSSTIIPEITGIDLNKLLILQSQGIYKDYKFEQINNPIVLKFYDFEVGRTIESINIEELEKEDFILKIKSIYGENDVVESVLDCASRHLMVVLKGGDNEIEKFNKLLKIKYY